MLFIGLSFLIYFLFEIFAGLRLHPLQYLLLGLANCMFYLLLLALFLVLAMVMYMTRAIDWYALEIGRAAVTENPNE